MSNPNALGLFRRRWVWVLGGVLVFMLIPAASVMAVITFTDVPSTHTHYQGIQYVASKNLTTGYPDGTFLPDNNLTRGQMATFLYRASGNDPATPPSVNADKVDGMDAGQMVAAGIHVTRSGTDEPVIRQWFNSVNGVEPRILGGSGDGFYRLDVGFATRERYLVVTLDSNYVDTRDAVASVWAPTVAGLANVVQVQIFDVSEGGPVPAEFYVMIF